MAERNPGGSHFGQGKDYGQLQGQKIRDVDPTARNRGPARIPYGGGGRPVLRVESWGNRLVAWGSKVVTKSAKKTMVSYFNSPWEKKERNIVLSTQGGMEAKKNNDHVEGIGTGCQFRSLPTKTPRI